MKRDRNYLIETYNATSTGNENDELETYEAWLERQLLSRLDKIEELELLPETEEIEFYIGTPSCYKCDPVTAGQTYAPTLAGKYKCNACGYVNEIPSKTSDQ